MTQRTRRWALAAFATGMLGITQAVSAQVTGPTYPAPGGNTFTPVSGSATLNGGKEASYTNFNPSAFGSLFWTFSSIDNPFVQGFASAGSMDFVNVDASGTAIWKSSGSLTWQDAFGNVINAGPVYLNAQIKSVGSADGHVSSAALSWTSAGAAGIGSLPSAWAVFDVASNPGNSFDLWTEFTVGNTVANGGTGLDNFYNTFNNRGELTQVGTTGGFYASAPVTATPEPASLVLLATGLAGLGGVRFHKKSRATS